MNQHNSLKQNAESDYLVTNENKRLRLTQQKDENKSAIHQQQLNQQHQIMQDIHFIIESNTINNEEKEMKLNEVFNELKKKEKHKLRKIFNFDANKLILSYINDCRTGIEKILIDIIELLSEKGQQSYNNQFFYSFQYSGIIDKIQHLIKDKINKEKEQKKYSEETEQLTIIHLQIMKGRKSDQQMIDIYDKVINKNINNLLNIINFLKEVDEKAINNQMNKEKIVIELKQSTQLIKVLLLIKEKDPNYGTRIPDQIIKIIKEKVSPLIHINCSNDIYCTQRIIIQASSALQELKEAVFQALFEVSNNNYEIRNMLNQDNNFLPHLAPFIISYSTQYQLEQKTNINQQQHQQQSEYSSSLSFISSSILFLYQQIRNNNKCKQIIKIPNLLHSLTILINYNHNMHINNEQDQQSQQIIKWSRDCLNSIQSNGDEQDQSELINVGYGRLLIISISTAGGTEEQKDEKINYGLRNISEFLSELNKFNNNDQPSFPPQPALSKTCIEQIEEEGGNEEVESQLINKWNDDDYNMKYQAIMIKANFLNFYINKRKPRRW